MLTHEELKQISDLIADIEKHTAGEIRVVLQKKKHFFERKKSVFDLAVHEFRRLKMDRTDRRSGVLIFVLEKDREFQILGDVEITKKIQPEEWNQMAKKLTTHFQHQGYLTGIKELTQEIGRKLIVEFPVVKKNSNELPNDVILR